MYENSLIYQLLVYIIYDFFNVVGMEPHYTLVSFEPCLLFAAVAAAVALYVEYALVHCNKSVKVFECLFISDSVQRVQTSLVVYRKCFVYESFVEHLQYTCIYTVVQFFTVAIQPDLYYIERTFFLVFCLNDV